MSTHARLPHPTDTRDDAAMALPVVSSERRETGNEPNRDKKPYC